MTIRRMAFDDEMSHAPAGAVWRHPQIVELLDVEDADSVVVSDVAIPKVKVRAAYH